MVCAANQSETEDTMDHTKLETAAAKYSWLRGLFHLPGGLLFIVAALGNWEVGPFAHTWAVPVAVVAIGAACLPISRYYNEHYGRLTPSTRQQVRGGIAVVVAAAFM